MQRETSELKKENPEITHFMGGSVDWWILFINIESLLFFYQEREPAVVYFFFNIMIGGSDR